MRLTLRTLLAYLDDILEPSQAKEIGAKIAESDFASSLSNRIREVMRRRRLTAPDLDGPSSGIDPNVVAEYLDNTLSADLVADLEKICLDSDVHLAEVAASHQILTLVLGEPVEISTQSRERMYALAPPAPPVDPAAEPEWTGEAPATATAESNGDSAAAEKPARPVKSFSETIPDYLKPKPIWKRLFPYAAVIVLVAAFFGLILTDKGLFPHLFAPDTTVTNNDGNSPPGESIAANEPNKTALPAPSGKVSVDQGKTAAVEPAPKKKSTKMPPVAGIDPRPPEDKGANSKVGTSKPPAIVGNKPPVPLPKGNPPKVKGDGGTKVAKTDGTPVPPKPNTKVPAVAGNVPVLKFDPQNDRGMLLREATTSNDWHVLTDENVVLANQRIVSPKPFDSQIDVDRGRSRVTLMAGTSVRILPPSLAAAFGFDLENGQMVVRSPSTPKDGEIDVRVFLLKIRGKTWRVDLLTPDTVCGIEVLPIPVYGYDPAVGANAFTAAVYAHSGSVRVVNPQAEVVMVSGSKTNCGRLSLTRQNGQPATVDQFAIPSWLTGSNRLLTPVHENRARAYRKRFENANNTLDALAGKGVSMRNNIDAIIYGRNLFEAEYAVSALAATNSYAELASALKKIKMPHEESREAAVQGLRRWLATDPEHHKLLRTALQKSWPQEDADALYRLLWGFTKADARNPIKSRELVAWLGHKHVAIRELAFDNVFRLTGVKNGYGALLQKRDRQTAIAHWNAYLNRVGALLAPEVENKQP